MSSKNELPSYIAKFIPLCKYFRIDGSSSIHGFSLQKSFRKILGITTTSKLFITLCLQLENYETSLNGLRQCCSGTTSDLSDFKARSLSSLERLDVFLARNMQDQSTERCRQQIRCQCYKLS